MVGFFVFYIDVGAVNTELFVNDFGKSGGKAVICGIGCRAEKADFKISIFFAVIAFEIHIDVILKRKHEPCLGFAGNECDCFTEL